MYQPISNFSDAHFTIQKHRHNRISQQNTNILHTCNMCKLCASRISVAIPTLTGQSPASNPDMHAARPLIPGEYVLSYCRLQL